MNYDIIGDIHGQFDKLVVLLNHLGYAEINEVWSHKTHKAIFVGDLIDNKHDESGISHIKTVKLVKAMVEAGTALCIMGNHEFNAIAWLTPDPDDKINFLRPHNSNNGNQHNNFLAEVGENSVLHQEIIDWFKTLPLWLELPEGIRVIHAAWIEEYQAILKPYLGDNNTLTDELVIKASKKDSLEFIALEALCKGLETPLPSGYEFIDSHNKTRTQVRIPWWGKESYGTYREEALIAENARGSIPDVLITTIDPRVKDYTGVPVFVGHYWASGKPEPLTDKIACVDYSAGKAGHFPLVAYRWEGEQTLTRDGFRSAR
jgi:hypothetical protein